MPKTKKLNQTGSFWILCFQNWFSRCIVNLFSKTIFYVFSPKNSLCHLLLISFKKKNHSLIFLLKKKKKTLTIHQTLLHTQITNFTTQLTNCILTMNKINHNKPSWKIAIVRNGFLSLSLFFFFFFFGVCGRK